ncbi:hypothetical protein ACFWGN_17850 [Oerskovia sp. NPDC060338]|uniref:hypothetical protein n=1 Tax=Oerskovia sp. NPDC060338 TaxID=3347100 RepID=UPI00364A750B
MTSNTSTFPRYQAPNIGVPKHLNLRGLRFMTAGEGGGEGGSGEGDGAKYTPPATQADLDKIIGARVERTKAQYADYDDLKTKATEFDKLTEASKTEAQKQADALAAAQKELDGYKTREQSATWASEIVKDSAVPASALRGSTREELQAHFEELKPLVTKAHRGPVIPRQGDTPSTPAGDDEARVAARRLFGTGD